MLDKSLPMCYVLMVKEDTEVYPRYSLPDGYSFKFYEKGDEKTWVEIEMTVGQFQTMEEGLASFNAEFVEGHTLQPEERIFFVIDSNGKAVATGALWNGEWKGETKQRMHWIAVDESCKGKGIAKAIVTKALDLYNELGYKGFIYLITESWCYSAVNIYEKFGFKLYEGEMPTQDFGISNEEFIKQNELGIKLIKEKIQSYKK